MIRFLKRMSRGFFAMACFVLLMAFILGVITLPQYLIERGMADLGNGIYVGYMGIFLLVAAYTYGGER